MANSRCDLHIPSYIQATVAGNEWLLGEFTDNNGAVGLSVQCVTSNGAAGTIYLDGTNQNGTTPAWVNTFNQPVGPNQTVIITNSLIDDVTAMARYRCRFVASAAGNVRVSVNSRRTTY